MGLQRVGHDWETFTHSLIQLRIESYLQLWFITAEGHKGKSAREKAHGQSLEETQDQLPRAFSQLSHTGRHSTSSEIWQYVWNAVYQGHSSEIQSCWSCGHSLPNTYQKSQLLEGKQVLNINHVVWSNILDSVSHSHHIGKVSQSCPTLCNPMDCSPTSSSVHGVLQARILEWIAIPCSRGSSFQTQGLNLDFLHCRQILYHLSQQGSPRTQQETSK